MQRIAAWTNLSETTFVLPPTLAGRVVSAAYLHAAKRAQVRRTSTIGSAHAVLAAGLATPVGGTLHQECRAGLLPIRVDGERLMVRVPDPDVRPEAVADAGALGDMVGAPIAGVPRAVDCGRSGSSRRSRRSGAPRGGAGSRERSSGSRSRTGSRA
jgi:predicted PhzF superfamily epimerase YddE/YHI9